jgi:hypothetical protein
MSNQQSQVRGEKRNSFWKGSFVMWQWEMLKRNDTVHLQWLGWYLFVSWPLQSIHDHFDERTPLHRHILPKRLTKTTNQHLAFHLNNTLKILCLSVKWKKSEMCQKVKRRSTDWTDNIRDVRDRSSGSSSQIENFGSGLHVNIANSSGHCRSQLRSEQNQQQQ